MPLHPQESEAIKHVARRRLLSLTSAVIALTIPAIVLPSLFNNLPQPMRTSSLTGRQYMDEVLNCGNSRRFQEIFRMKLEVFRFLCSELENKGGLHHSRHVAVDEKVGMFLWTMARAASNWDA
jgi:DDE superfamily endonuclease